VKLSESLQKQCGETIRVYSPGREHHDEGKSRFLHQSAAQSDDGGIIDAATRLHSPIRNYSLDNHGDLKVDRNLRYQSGIDSSSSSGSSSSSDPTLSDARADRHTQRQHIEPTCEATSTSGELDFVQTGFGYNENPQSHGTSRGGHDHILNQSLDHMASTNQDRCRDLSDVDNMYAPRDAATIKEDDYFGRVRPAKHTRHSRGFSFQQGDDEVLPTPSPVSEAWKQGYADVGSATSTPATGKVFTRDQRPLLPVASLVPPYPDQELQPVKDVSHGTNSTSEADIATGHSNSTSSTATSTTLTPSTSTGSVIYVGNRKSPLSKFEPRGSPVSILRETRQNTGDSRSGITPNMEQDYEGAPGTRLDNKHRVI
jgi:hypothetical protein